MYIHNAKVQSS